MVFSPQTFLTARTHFCAFLLYVHHHQTLCSTRRGQGKYMDCLSNPPCEGMLQAFSTVRAVISGIFALVSCCAGQGGEHSWKLPPGGSPACAGGRQGWWAPQTSPLSARKFKLHVPVLLNYPSGEKKNQVKTPIPISSLIITYQLAILCCLFNSEKITSTRRAVPVF